MLQNLTGCYFESIAETHMLHDLDCYQTCFSKGIEQLSMNIKRSPHLLTVIFLSRVQPQSSLPALIELIPHHPRLHSFGLGTCITCSKAWAVDRVLSEFSVARA